jgi:hypothetical protein
MKRAAAVEPARRRPVAPRRIWRVFEQRRPRVPARPRFTT